VAAAASAVVDSYLSVSRLPFASTAGR
jgi:hypothetical protein